MATKNFSESQKSLSAFFEQERAPKTQEDLDSESNFSTKNEDILQNETVDNNNFVNIEKETNSVISPKTHEKSSESSISNEVKSEEKLAAEAALFYDPNGEKPRPEGLDLDFDQGIY